MELESTVAVKKNYDRKFLEDSLRYMEAIEQQSIEQMVILIKKYDKPVIEVYFLNDDKTWMITEVEGCKYKGVNFITPE